MKNIENIAVISGASSGIGEAIAKELAKNNITVCLGARSTKRLDKIVDQIRDIGGNAYSFYLDFLDDKSINYFVDNVKRIGMVNTVINNSGFGKFNSIENTKIEDWDKMISVNLRGAFVLCRSFIPNMKKNKSCKKIPSRNSLAKESVKVIRIKHIDFFNIIRHFICYRCSKNSSN